MDAPKLIFFDMEGTLFQKAYHLDNGKVAPSAWTVLAEQLGTKVIAEAKLEALNLNLDGIGKPTGNASRLVSCLELEERSKDKYNEKGYRGYAEWMYDTIRIQQLFGLQRDHFETVVGAIDYHPGVKEAFAALKSDGRITALVSGGFKAQADRAQRDLKIDHAIAGCEYFWDKNGKLEHWNLLPTDYEGKVAFMHMVMKEHKLTPDECGFVGDGKNDVPLAKEVYNWPLGEFGQPGEARRGVSVAFNAQPELEKAARYSVRQPQGEENFWDVMKYFSPE